jgi:hypothetical protein
MGMAQLVVTAVLVEGVPRAKSLGTTACPAAG